MVTRDERMDEIAQTLAAADTPVTLDTVKAALFGSRSCGSCALCCKVLNIADLDKPAGVWCRHAKPGAACGACSIHPSTTNGVDTRPAVCDGFACAWLTGMMGDDPTLRPDVVRAVVTTSENGWLCVYPDQGQPDAWRGHRRFAATLGEIAKTTPVLIVVGSRRTILANGNTALDKAKAIMSKAGIDWSMVKVEVNGRRVEP